MLLRFSVENWMSFRDEATLDLVATREEQHANHLAPIAKYGLKLLPVAAIYGANASGKSNLVKALSFVQQFITNPPRPDAPIIFKPFLLNRDSSKRPTKFRIEFLIEETIYEYRFSITAEKVMEEELKRINATTEELLFRRGLGKRDFTLYGKIQEQDEQNFAFHGTNDNQLFLTNSVSQKLREFKPIFDWFKNGMKVILPESRYNHFSTITNEVHPLFNKMIDRLRGLDSGIALLRQIEFPPDVVFPKDILDQMSVSLKEGQSIFIGPDLAMDTASLHKRNGTVIARQVAPIHYDESGEEVPFNFTDESDGTRRLLDVLPAFLSLEEKQLPIIFVIDELDRSLHSNLTRDLLEHFLAQRTDSSRSQLIFTTHDTQLMTQDIFRRDEIWIAERDQFGASKLVAFSEFKDVRKDKDIRKSYLQGRMGGVPRIRTANPPCEDEASVR